MSLLLTLSLGFIFSLYSLLWFQVTLPVVFSLAAMIIPNICFTQLVMRPMLHEFDEWKHHLTSQLEKANVEIIKITSGELISDKASIHFLWSVIYGSSCWFRYQDVEVEIFWRLIKSAKRIRRYSLIANPNYSETPTNIKMAATLGSQGHVISLDSVDKLNSLETLDQL